MTKEIRFFAFKRKKEKVLDRVRTLFNVLLLLLFLTFSALVANPKKTTLHGGQSRSWSAEQGKKEKEKVWQRMCRHNKILSFVLC